MMRAHRRRSGQRQDTNDVSEQRWPENHLRRKGFVISKQTTNSKLPPNGTTCYNSITSVDVVNPIASFDIVTR